MCVRYARQAIEGGGRERLHASGVVRPSVCLSVHACTGWSNDYDNNNDVTLTYVRLAYAAVAATRIAAAAKHPSLK